MRAVGKSASARGPWLHLRRGEDGLRHGVDGKCCRMAKAASAEIRCSPAAPDPSVLLRKKPASIFALKEANGRIATCGRWGLLKARCHFTPVEGLCGEVLIDVFDAGIISSTRFSSGVSWVHVEWKRGASAS